MLPMEKEIKVIMAFRATVQVVPVVSVKAAESNSRSVDLQLCHATVPCTGAHGDQDFQDIPRENHTLSHQKLNRRKKEQSSGQKQVFTTLRNAEDVDE